MATTGTRLFKLASQINVGKETIVEFLQAKGFKIENKGTATLTDEMTELVLGNFQKEHNAAEKQRAKTATAHKAAHSEQSVSAEAAHGHAPETHAAVPESSATSGATRDVSSRSESRSDAAEASVDAMDAVAADTASDAEVATPRSGKSKQAKASEAAEESGVSVGTVISLDGLIPSRRGKGKKETDAPTAKETKGAGTKTAASTAGEKSDKSDKSSKRGKEKLVADDAFVAEAATRTPVSSAQAEAGPSSSAVENEIGSETKSHAQGEAGSSTPAQEPPAAAADSAPRTGEADGHSADADDAHDHDADGEGAHKKKRRKKIGEIEYAPTGNYASEIVRPNLTIVGKIDLDAGRRPRGGDRDANAKRGAEKPRTDDRKPAVKVKGMPSTSTRSDEGAPKRPVSGGGGGAGVNKKKRKKGGKREQVNAEDVERAIRRTLSGQDDSALASRSRLRQRRRAERAEQEERAAELRELESSILRVTEFVTVAELANIMGVPTNEVIMKCMSLGLMVSINQRLEKDTITLIADDYGFTVEFEDAFSEDVIEDEEDPEETLVARAPIVTVMGHVDHGKTSLLDYIRKTSVVTGESGGITQHIGAYSVKMNDGKFITFLDTPGHQAFTAMRARGAQVTDIVVLVVAADDSVMPQTIEAISHARAANVPMIVAINKIDKPEANPDRIRQQLADQNVLVEEWGGKFQSVELSAKKGLNVEQLLEKILLEAELLNLRANPDRYARAAVVESKIDKGKGPVATVIVQKGTLRVGDPFVTGIYAGRVRAMLDEKGERVELAIPSTPVQLLGLDGVPQAGDTLVAMDSESAAKEIANKRQQIKREQDFKQIRHVTLDDLAQRIEAGGVQELKIILKGDTDGSVEALTDSLQKLATPEVGVTIILRAVGPISESDVMLAAASDAVIIGFHVRPTPQSAKLAENEGVDIRLYRIIYDCINEVKLALEGMLRPEIKEEVAGVAEIRDIFRISKVGNIAGCYVLEGKINRNDTVRLVRDGFEVVTGRLASLKRLKDDVREVDAGFECGMSLEGYNDIRVGDFIEAVRKTEVKRKL
jgi:translation initiation factor IF-2